MKTTGNYFYPLLVFTCMCFSYAGAKTVVGDSLKQKYAITDPRNPDCPCHKYQALANKEYKKLQKEEMLHSTGISDQTKLSVHVPATTLKRRTYFFGFKSSSAKARSAKQIKKSSIKHKRLWRKRSAIDACKRWR